jgi:hypothetical protein
VHDYTETQSVSELSAAQAILDTVDAAIGPVEATSSDKEDIPKPSNLNQQPPDGSQKQASEPPLPEFDEKGDNTPKGGAK